MGSDPDSGNSCCKDSCETSLYAPVKKFLEGQGYSVKGEISGCDVLAERDGVLVAIELKMRMSLKLILQAVDRLEAVELVYVAVPAGCVFPRSSRASLLRLLRMLGIGLLLVDEGRASVFPALDPCEYRPRRISSRRTRLIREYEALVGDPNQGGSGRRRGLMTVYRQRALVVADYLRRNGPTKASILSASTGEKDARSILYRNVYGWFEKLGKGIYSLSPKGEKGLEEWIR